MSKAERKLRRALHRQYKRELSQYWKLPLVTRIKLALAIVFKTEKESNA